MLRKRRIGTWGCLRCFWHLLVPRVHLINVVEQDLPWTNVAFVSGLHGLFCHVGALHSSIEVLVSWKCAFCGFLWDESVFEGISLDIKLYRVVKGIGCCVKCIRGVIVQNVVDLASLTVSGIFEKILELLIVETLLANSNAVILLPGVAIIEVESWSCFRVLVCQDRALSLLNFLVVIRSGFEVGRPLEWSGFLVLGGIVNGCTS